MTRPAQPDRIRTLVLTGRDLTLEQVVAVARYRARVELSPDARRGIGFSRAVVERLVAARCKVYGLTTGFGSKRDTIIEPGETEQLQLNLIRSHACGVGPALPEDTVRAAMLLRANTLARGNSGIRLEVVETVLEFLNRDVYPWIPSRGSLGASGDLAPLSHLALALCHDPGARFYWPSADEPAPVRPGGGDGTRPDYVADPVGERFGPAPDGLFGPDGIRPVVLQAKEGLALNNGTQVSTALGMLAAFDATVLLDSADLVAALSLEANKAVRAAFDTRLQDARPFPGQQETAARIRSFTADSAILDRPLNTARLYRARRALDGAAEELRSGDAPGPAAAFADEAERLAREVEAYAARAATLPDDEGPAVSDGEREGLTPAQLMHTVYRRTLVPIRGGVLRLYASILESDLVGEALKSRDYLADAVSQLAQALPETPTVQDDYSFRCVPQVLGAVRRVLAETREVLEIEGNSATDNPLIFPPRTDTWTGTEAEYADDLSLEECQGAVVSGGNFHGEPIAFALDSLGIALAELANISERRTAHLVDGNLSNGLPSLLVERSGLNSGLMIPQYVAAALVSENKVLAHPASVDSIPSCENTEDHVSMSPIAALKCRQILENAETVVAIELLTAWQGMVFRRPLTAGRATERLWREMEADGLTPVLTDRVLYPDIEWAAAFLRSGRVWRIACDAQPA